MANADPAFAYVNIDQEGGYEYKGEDGRIHGPFPSIAIFTWSLKGLLPQEKQLRRQGQSGFRRLSEYAKDIFKIARVQLTTVMLDGKEWFYVDEYGNVQGPFSAEQMLSFISSRYIKESVRFYSRPFASHNDPSPTDLTKFHCFGDLLTETLEAYRLELKKFRERVYSTQSSVNASTTSMPTPTVQVSNPIVASSASRSPTVSQPFTATEGVPVSSHPNIPSRPEPSFIELREMYSEKLSEYSGCDYYLLFNGEVHGPYSGTKIVKPCLDRLDALDGIAYTRAGDAEPDRRHFFPFEDFLRQFHAQKKRGSG